MKLHKKEKCLRPYFLAPVKKLISEDHRQFHTKMIPESCLFHTAGKDAVFMGTFMKRQDQRA